MITMNDLHKIAVGQRYHPERRSWPELTQYNFRGGMHELVLFFNGVTAKDIDAYHKGTIDAGFSFLHGIVNFLWRPAGLQWSDSPTARGCSCLRSG